jgi:hypothetical protein
VQIKCSEPLRPIKYMFENFVEKNSGLRQALANCKIEMGPSNDPEYMTPPHAEDTPLYVGDSRQRDPGKWINGLYVPKNPHIGQVIVKDELEALAKKDPKAVTWRPVLNRSTGKYDIVGVKSADVVRGYVRDQAVLDAAPDMLTPQYLSPWNINWFPQIYRAPLLWSKVEEAVEIETGTNPWGTVMNLMMMDYAGWGSFEMSGAPSNTLVKNIDVQSGLMTAIVMNLTASYSLGLEELKRSEVSSSPFGSQGIAIKQQYAAYALQLLTDYLMIYGGATDTYLQGLLGVNAVTAYGGTSMNGLAVAAGASVGSLMYTGLIGILEPFLTQGFNKWEEVIVLMSPKAYNLINAWPYSQIYNPMTAAAAWAQNFAGGKMKDGKDPKITFLADPMLAATITTGTTGIFSNPFNPQTYDYTILLAPRVKAGPDEKMQGLVLAGMPLKEFAYPVIPAGYQSEYKFLRRYSGIYAPVPAAVAAYHGFGQQSTST